MSTLNVNFYDANYEALTSEERAQRLLTALPKAIGMKPISEPKIITYYPEEPDDWGVTGDSLAGDVLGRITIATSHIHIHTWPERLYARIEISSCEPFHAYDAQQAIRKVYGEQGFFNVDISPWHLPPVKERAGAMA